MRRAVLTVISIVLLCACEGDIPVVGLDDDGREIETMVPSGALVERMSTTLGDVQESAIPSLDSERARKILGLRQARLGVFLTGSVGLGDWFKIGGNVGLQLGLSNKK